MSSGFELLPYFIFTIMNELSRIFNYNGNSITIRVKNGVAQVNLTEAARAFPDKNLTTIVNSKEITDYITRLIELKNFSSADLLDVTRGGDIRFQGTWAYKLVAIRVAQKLDPDFAIWVDERIDELTRLGFTATDLTIERLTNDPDLLISLATQLKQERYAKQKAMEEKTKAERLALEARAAEEQERKEKEIAVATIEQQRPDVEFSHNYIDAEGETVMEVAKRLEDFGYIIAARTCYDFLNAIHFLFKRDGKWCAYETARNLGYVKYGNIKEDEYMMGNPKAPKITNKGFKKILDTIKKKPEVFLNYGKFGNKNN